MDGRPQDIPVKKLITALLAISFGTIIEWVGESAYGTALYRRSEGEKEHVPCTASAGCSLCTHSLMHHHMVPTCLPCLVLLCLSVALACPTRCHATAV